MHFHITTIEVLWTLTFAALLVLLVVLLGRDRARRFPFFTASMAVVALRLLATRLLFGRMAPMALSKIVMILADLSTLASLLVIIELARRAFPTASRRAAVVATAAALAVSGAAMAAWGPWPAWKTLTADDTLSNLRLMQMFAQKGDLLAALLAIELGLLVLLFGRRFKAGWRSHAQRIVIGLSTAAMAQLAVRGAWQLIALKAVIHSRAEYERIMGLQGRMYEANNVIYFCVLVWWIVCLWMDEPGQSARAVVASRARTGAPAQPAVTGAGE